MEPTKNVPSTQFVSAEEFAQMEQVLKEMEEQYKAIALPETPELTRHDLLKDFLKVHQLIGGPVAMAAWAASHPANRSLFYTKMLTRALPAAAQDINVNGEVVIKHVLPKTALDDHSDIEGEFHEIDSKGG